MAIKAERIASGDLKKDQEDVGSATGLYLSMNVMTDNLRTMIATVLTKSDQVSGASGQLQGVFENLVSGISVTGDKSTEVSASAKEMSSNVGIVSTAAEEASKNVSMVAAAIEEMTSNCQ